MKEKIIAWLLYQIADKKRVSIVATGVIVFLLKHFNVEMPTDLLQGFVDQGADLYMAGVALWSKISADRAAKAASTGTTSPAP